MRSCLHDLGVWLCLLLVTSAAHAQVRLNLGLEPHANHGYPLALWNRHRAPGVRVQFDSTVFRQGKGSLRLELVEEERQATGLETRAKLGSGSPPSLRVLARQRYYLRLVEQGATLRRLPPDFADNYRAACLAENVQYLSQHEGPPGSPPKLLVWAHNQQIAKSAGAEHSLGQWLRATHGTTYFALGLALGQGQYTTENASGQRAATPLEAAPPGSYEAWLRSGPPTFFVGLTKLELGATNAWLFQQQLLRDASIRTVRHQFGLHDLRGEFDGVVFLRDSTPTHFLP